MKPGWAATFLESWERGEEMDWRRVGIAPDKPQISPLVERTFTLHVTETPLATTPPDVTPPATFTPRPTVTFTGTPRPTPGTLTVTPTPRVIYLPAMMRE